MTPGVAEGGVGVEGGAEEVSVPEVEAAGSEVGVDTAHPVAVAILVEAAALDAEADPAGVATGAAQACPPNEQEQHSNQQTVATPPLP